MLKFPFRLMRWCFIGTAVPLSPSKTISLAVGVSHAKDSLLKK